MSQSETSEQGVYPKFEALQKIADGLERDRREPDKVLCYVLSLRRLAVDIRDGRL